MSRGTRPIGKEEPCADGAQQQQQQHEAAVDERYGQRRNLRMRLRGGGGAGLQVQLLRTTADAQAFAVQGLVQARAMGEHLLRRWLSSRS